ncbi:NLI-interacting factor, putative [Bodo saltans]|uniref:Mitochondrial import inner membrane translocase subunit TIM50 n=1 Tax=Bodo saltans TaxID=75058 RepID=A0A0S4JU68_BODSA|nr:NLI-interacting factor, putative [Bodo saltans]|eukprot:CUG93782.1 NLI-interacting factor, putative [Bodo saltans]
MRVSFLKLCTVPTRKEWHGVHWPVPLPPMLHTIAQANNQKATTPHATKKKHTLVLDIDDTLLRFEDTGRHENKRLQTFHVSLRPHVGAFLKEMHELFEIVMYTAAVPSYGAAMTNLLEKAAGLPPSPYYDATVPWGCFDSREKVSEEEAKVMRYAPVLGKDHVNWYLLTRSQTLNSSNLDKMKHLPILGRDADSTVIIDDNVRSFPLNPRAGIKISCFRGKDDDALLQLSPMLRAVAASPSALRELDHWRADEYVKCDKFYENMNYSSDVRNRILGTVEPKRRDSAIPALVAVPINAKFLEEATKLASDLFEDSEKVVKDQKAKATAFSKS